MDYSHECRIIGHCVRMLIAGSKPSFCRWFEASHIGRLWTAITLTVDRPIFRTLIHAFRLMELNWKVMGLKLYPPESFRHKGSLDVPRDFPFNIRKMHYSQAVRFCWCSLEHWGKSDPSQVCTDLPHKCKENLQWRISLLRVAIIRIFYYILSFWNDLPKW